MQWTDYRLKYQTKLDADQALQLDGHLLEKLWIPTVFFPKEKIGLMHEIIRDNIEIQIFENGTVAFNQR